jgi:hypothetical protein
VVSAHVQTLPFFVPFCTKRLVFGLVVRTSSLLELNLTSDLRPGLVSTVKERLVALQATRVFFASDAPSKDGTLRSFSYMALKDSEKRIKMAQDAAEYVLSNLEAVTWEMFDKTVMDVDAGIQAMLDKIICVDAEAFVVAPDACIGTPSEFAMSIGKARVEAGRAQGVVKWALPVEQKVINS